MMGSVTATAARKDLYNLIARVNENSAPITITNNRGKGAVLIGEDDWAAIEETLYLNSISGMSASLEEGMAESVSNCVGEDDLEW